MNVRLVFVRPRERPTRLAARPLVVATLLASAFAAPARATELRVDGDYRLRFADNTNLTLDDQGTKLNQQTWFEQRLRLTPVLVAPEEIEIESQFDIFAGLFAGDTAPYFLGLGWTGRSQQDSLQLTGFDFRALFVAFKLPYGNIKFGQMPFDWGMGLMWSSGNEVETIDFGDQRFGDIVERIQFSNKPFDFLGPRNPLSRNLSFLIGGDLVYRDRLASLVEKNGGGLEWGDQALQYFLGLDYNEGESTRVGLIAVRRWQSFARNAGDLHQWTFDLFARHAEPIEELDAVLTLELEAAASNGGTTHSQGFAAPGDVSIAQGGGAMRARLAFPEIEGELEGGYASGDANPFDASENGFSFNRDYKLSLVLWDEVMLFQTQNGAARLASASNGAHPVNGVDLIPTEGAVTDALYLKPTVRWSPGFFLGKVRFTGALLWAVAPAPVVDVYSSLLRSTPLNAFGAAAGRDYGLELDGAVTFRDRFFNNRLALELGAQYGILFPGDVFDRPDGSKMGKAVAAKLRLGIGF